MHASIVVLTRTSACYLHVNEWMNAENLAPGAAAKSGRNESECGQNSSVEAVQSLWAHGAEFTWHARERVEVDLHVPCSLCCLIGWTIEQKQRIGPEQGGALWKEQNKQNCWSTRRAQIQRCARALRLNNFRAGLFLPLFHLHTSYYIRSMASSSSSQPGGSGSAGGGGRPAPLQKQGSIGVLIADVGKEVIILSVHFTITI